jgi:hypothetical protein
MVRSLTHLHDTPTCTYIGTLSVDLVFSVWYSPWTWYTSRDRSRTASMYLLTHPEHRSSCYIGVRVIVVLARRHTFPLNYRPGRTLE